MSVEPYKYHQSSFSFEFAKTVVLTSACTVLFKVVLDSLNNIPNEFGDTIVNSIMTRDISVLTNVGFSSALSWIFFPNPTKHSLFAMLAYATLSCVLFSKPEKEDSPSEGAAKRMFFSTLLMLPIAKLLGISYANAIPINGLIYIFVNTIRSSLQLFDRSYSKDQCYTWFLPFGVTLAGLYPTFNFSNPELPSTFSVVGTAAAISGLAFFTRNDLAFITSVFSPHLIKIWRKETNVVIVWRKGNHLNYENYYARTSHKITGPLRVEDNINKSIKELKNADVYLLSSGAPQFVGYETCISAPSYMARLMNPPKDIIVDENKWAVSLVSVGPSWHGHAGIIIEGIEYGKKTRYFAHLRGGSNFRGCKAIVSGAIAAYSGDAASVVLEQSNLDTFLDFEVKSIAKIWEVSRAQADKMLEAIDKERLHQMRGGIAVFFAHEGSSSIISFIKMKWSAFRNQYVRPHNCLTWAKEKLELAGINFELSGLSYLFATPEAEVRISRWNLF